MFPQAKPAAPVGTESAETPPGTAGVPSGTAVCQPGKGARAEHSQGAVPVLLLP